MSPSFSVVIEVPLQGLGVLMRDWHNHDVLLLYYRKTSACPTLKLDNARHTNHSVSKHLRLLPLLCQLLPKYLTLKGLGLNAKKVLLGVYEGLLLYHLL